MKRFWLRGLLFFGLAVWSLTVGGSAVGALTIEALTVGELAIGGLAEGKEPLRSMGVVIDQPPGVVMKTESQLFCEVMERLVAVDSACSMTILLPAGTDRFVTRDGSPVSLESFETLCIYQGDEFVETTPLFASERGAVFSAWLNAKPTRGMVLVGGAVALMNSVGYGPMSKTALTFGNDRAQSGTIPVNPLATIFSGVNLDRETVWMTNAVYPAYLNIESESPDVAILSTPTTGESSGLLVGLGGESSAGGGRVAKVFALAWSVDPLYSMAHDGFQQNFETLLANLLTKAGGTISPADWTPPAWRLPDFAPLRRALEEEVAIEEELADGSGAESLPRRPLAAWEDELTTLETCAETIQDAAGAEELMRDFVDLQRRVLLSSPSLDFEEILFVRRSASNLALPANYLSNSSLAPRGHQNRIERLNFRTGVRSTLFEPKNNEFVGDMELHFDGERILFSMPDISAENRWRLWEMVLSRTENNGMNRGASPTRIELINEPDVDVYDACYLPDDRLVFCSTACFTGVPCVNGVGHVCNLYLREQDGTIRQLTVEQDHDWCPTVMNNGRVMYLRWEYTDLPHCYSRILFHMNPDGTNQSELYGSGSYWPTAIFYARPIPNHPTQFVGVTTGHHEEPRVGDLVLFDPAVARREADGAVQRIPGFGKPVAPTILDLPIAQTWPKFTHPYPIDDTRFLVSCKRSVDSGWTLCLVDRFDNIVTLCEEEGFALFEPVPLRRTPKPPVIPDRIKKNESTADVFIADIYAGEGMRGVERGTVQSLRVISYQFAYQGMGAEPYSIGLDGPWDPKRILGMVPVHEDGSAAFTIPAMTPVAFQPLDAEGKAVQLMRSWLTAMPGETVSCLGCHEPQNELATLLPATEASRSRPNPIAPFYGRVRGFSFDREIQPILDRYCLECHGGDAQSTAEALLRRGFSSAATSEEPCDFRTGPRLPLQQNSMAINTGALFSPSYYQLRRFVRTPTKESQMPVHKPYEFHADSTRLVQLLQNGHYDTALDAASWDRLVAWIDLNAPYHGDWGSVRNAEISEAVAHQYERRHTLRALYAPHTRDLDDDPSGADESSVPLDSDQPELRRNLRFVDTASPLGRNVGASTFAKPDRRTVEVASGISFELVTIPGTDFAISSVEVTNELFRLFDPSHDTGIEYGDFINFSPGELGYLLNRPNQPVARVTWNQAVAFCRWLSDKTGESFSLPTVEEWEYAARCGAETLPTFSDGDYSASENLADATFAAIELFGWTERSKILPEWRPADRGVSDGSRVSAPVASYAPNPWGLYDMLGNVAEWTATDSVGGDRVKRVVVGGSWSTPLSRVAQRRRFDAQQNIYDVGFRLVCPAR